LGKMDLLKSFVSPSISTTRNSHFNREGLPKGIKYKVSAGANLPVKIANFIYPKIRTVFL